MGNSAEAPYAITTPGTYYDVTPRVLRNVNSYPFNGTFTSTVTVATANAIPQITQGNEVMAFNHTATSLSSWLEFEIFTNIVATGAVSIPTTYYLALFADYSPDALIVSPGLLNTSAMGNAIPVYFKHYLMPVTLSPVRYSIRMATNQNTVVVNWFQYGGRTQSRVTVKEWSGLSLNNVAP
jgi:hypothetical protein